MYRFVLSFDIIFFREPKLIMVLVCIAIIFPLSSSSSAHLALLERDSKFKK